MNIQFTITDAAAKHIATIIAQQNLSNDYFFRLAVEGGGCSGFQYQMNMDNTLSDDDFIFKNGDIRTVIDSVSAPFLDGSTLDYKTSLGGSMLKITNPNASSSCGCGTSFNIQ